MTDLVRWCIDSDPRLSEAITVDDHFSIDVKWDPGDRKLYEVTVFRRPQAGGGLLFTARIHSLHLFLGDLYCEPGEEETVRMFLKKVFSFWAYKKPPKWIRRQVWKVFQQAVDGVDINEVLRYWRGGDWQAC